MAGLLKRIELFQFMCHEWLVFDFSPNINFIGPDAFRPEVYGDTIIIKRKIVQAGIGSGSYIVQDSCGKVVATKRDEIDAICDHFNINVTNPLSVLTQDRARSFLTNSSPEDK
ncbi:Structural maintenance of chromosomes protein 6 [Chytriomyces hyalinus]|nr:Structural maintenance of chromosomes protein 6 [Chytriomyces hyalinus]